MLVRDNDASTDHVVPALQSVNLPLLISHQPLLQNEHTLIPQCQPPRPGIMSSPKQFQFPTMRCESDLSTEFQLVMAKLRTKTYRSITPYTSSGFLLVSLTSATTTSVSIPFRRDLRVGWVSHGIGSLAG